MYSTPQKIRSAISNLADEFEFFLDHNILQDEEDFKVISEALTKAFACVPSCSQIPSQQREVAANKAAAMESFQQFLDKLS